MGLRPMILGRVLCQVLWNLVSDENSRDGSGSTYRLICIVIELGVPWLLCPFAASQNLPSSSIVEYFIIVVAGAFPIDVILIISAFPSSLARPATPGEYSDGEYSALLITSRGRSVGLALAGSG